MSISDFVYSAHAARVVFGAGSLQYLEREVLNLNAERVLILCSPEQRAAGEELASRLGSRAIAVFAHAAMHVPIELVSEAQELARAQRADCVITFGGGSAIGLGKAMAQKSDLPILAIPTTYAGSEMTPIYGITEGGVKRTGTDKRVLPKTVIYDPELTLTLPTQLSLTSGINAIAHAAEALYAREANPVISLLAEEGIAALARALPKVTAQPDNIAARSDALYGAWLCGIALGSVGMALHHKLCHTLGGSFDLPHAATHTIVLPHALAYNASAAPEAMKRIARAIRHDNAATGLYDLARVNGAPVALKDIGMKDGDLDRAARLACASPYWNPCEIEYAEVRALLQAAFDGTPPRRN